MQDSGRSNKCKCVHVKEPDPCAPSAYVENLTQMVRTLQHCDAEHENTIRCLTEKLRDLEDKQARETAQYCKIVSQLEEVKERKAEDKEAMVVSSTADSSSAEGTTSSTDSISGEADIS